MKKYWLVVLLALAYQAFAQKGSSSLDSKVKEFDAYTQSALRQWEVPGAAVAVIKDGKVIYKKGFGVADITTSQPVNTETLFSIGSTTKAMTAVCLGMLVDEGKIKWDDPVSAHLPELKLYDPFVTRELKIRDLLIHDSGVGNTDFLWGMMDISEDEILKRMQLVQPSYSFRAGFIYQNIFYVAAGKVIEKITGKPWEVFFQERIFKPLGMSRTCAKTAHIKDENYTRPHYKLEGKIEVIGVMNVDAVGAAGSVWSSISDMAAWTLCMLDSSKYAGGRLLHPSTWAEMFKPQTLVTAAAFYPTARLTKPQWTTYGLGWFQHDYKGHKINFHTGSLPGLTAIHGQLPDQKLAIYVLGNYDHAEVRHALMYKAFDHFALGGARDWSSEFLTLYTGITDSQKNEEAKREAMHVTGTNPTVALSAYAGTYTDPLYGELVVQEEGTGLKLTVNNFERALLDHANYDTFYVLWEKKWFGKATASFRLGTAGKVENVSLAGMEFRKVN
ncbi:MAG: serine hydrolase [Cytophagales bacterium]|nr:serine hydrolase [Cytophagales bacterium]